MSRSALERQEAIRAARGQLTEPTYTSLEDDREVKSNELPIHGNQTTYNLNTLLANRIYECDYFRALYQLRTYHEVIDEIYNRVSDVEPWATGTSRLPSTAFCLLFKFFTMRLTKKQILGLINHKDSPYIRAVGFLYLRFVCDPKEIWSWISEYVNDPEEFQPASDKGLTMTVGEWLQKLVTEQQYFGTVLPRIPVPIERKIKMRLVLNEEKKKRARANRRTMSSFRVGAKVKAIYEDDENDPAWYDAIINSIEDDDQYLVTFTGYGNQEVVGLGDLMVPPEANKRGGSRERSRSVEQTKRSRSRSRDREREGRRKESRSRSRSRDRGRRRSRCAEGNGEATGSLLGKNLLDAVMKKEREAVAAVGKDYAQRPASYKGSLSLKIDRYTARRKSRSPSPRRDDRSSRRRSPSPRRRSPPRRDEPPPRRERAAEESEKLKKLKERYGDASAKTD